LSRLGLPVKLESGLSRERVREAMTRDKKNRGPAIRFALPAEVGVMARGENWTVEPPMSLVAECLERLG
jgi:3-dehydroquinate synthetase